MAEAQLQMFLEKVRQLNAFVALSEADPRLRQELRDCEHHDEVVALARRCGFEIGRRWGEPPPPEIPPGTGADREGTAQRPGAGAGERAMPLHDPDGRRMAPGQEPEPAGDDDASTTTQRPNTGAVDAAEAEACHEGGWSLAVGGPAARPSGDPIVSLGQGACPPPGEEVIQVLLDTPTLRLERIHSCAAESPEGFWYDQREDEWVVLLQGSARLQFADEREERPLQAGDSLLIRAGRRHRVSATDPAPGTVWLALFWRHS